MVAVGATDQDGEVPTALAAFSPQTRGWFETVFAEPTPAQDAAWQAISAGQSTLVVAPTGSGKTLAAFLWALDRCASCPSKRRGYDDHLRLPSQSARRRH